MSGKLINVAIQNQSFLWPALSAIGTFSAAIVALGIALRSILKDRRERMKSLVFIKIQILTYLQATRTNFENYFKKGQSFGTTWENYNAKNFEILEMLFRSSTPLADEDVRSFMKFVLYFKGCPALRDQKVIEEFKTKLDEIINAFGDD